MLTPACQHCFSKLVPLRQLFDNHYTVGTEISTLYQTEHQRAAATLKTRFAVVNAVERDLIKALKICAWVSSRPQLNVRQINVVLTWTVSSLACKSTCNSIP